MKLPFLVTIHNTYTVVTRDFVGSPMFQKRYTHKFSPAKNKISIKKRNSRIIQIGHSTRWRTFITLTFNNSNYFTDPSLIQPYFRRFIKKIYYIYYLAYRSRAELPERRESSKLSNRSECVGGIRPTHTINTKNKFVIRNSVNKHHNINTKFRYLAVLEYGAKNGRLHFHMLTNLKFNNPDFFTKPKLIKLRTKSTLCNKVKKFILRSRIKPNLWNYGYSDVVRVTNKNCNAVYYLCKYLTKSSVLRVPLGKREVFSSRGLNPVFKIRTFDPERYIDNMGVYVNIGRSTIYIKKKDTKK